VWAFIGRLPKAKSTMICQESHSSEARLYVLSSRKASLSYLRRVAGSLSTFHAWRAARAFTEEERKPRF
jgi:hypothetical protein